MEKAAVDKQVRQKVEMLLFVRVRVNPTNLVNKQTCDSVMKEHNFYLLNRGG